MKVGDLEEVKTKKIGEKSGELQNGNTTSDMDYLKPVSVRGGSNERSENMFGVSML
jgi:hypothetical protein